MFYKSSNKLESEKIQKLVQTIVIIWLKKL